MSLQSLLEEYSKARKEFLGKAKTEFKKEIKEFFKQCPEVKVVKWCQYTPYFNDGEPCVFRVGEPVFSNAENHEDVSVYGEYEGEEEDVWTIQGTYGLRDLPKELSHLKPKLQEFSKLVGSDEMEDVLYDLFDDHSVVVATKEDIIVDSYEHD